MTTTAVDLPEAAAKLTKKNRATMQRWNTEVRKVLEERGAVLVHQYSATVTSLIGYDYLRFELETKAGKLTISPSGNWLACCFEDPDRAVPFLREWLPFELEVLNRHSGKWNFNFFGHPFQDALDRVRSLFDKIKAAA